MKLNRIILGIFAGAALLWGCQPDDAVNAGDGVITVNPSIVEAASAGETLTLSVTSSEAWTAKSDSSWVTISPSSGAASASAVKVSVTVGKNPTEKARPAQITFTAGASKKIVSISQKPGGIEYGTLENPYTVAKVVEFCADLADKTPSKEVYVKGIVSQVVEEYGTQYGNGTFWISDDGSRDGAQFEAYRILYLENEKWAQKHVDAKAKNVAVGDVVVIYGPVQNYGGTPETASGAYLYSIEEGTAPILSCSNAEQTVVASTTEVKFTITPANVNAWTVKAKETYDWVTDFTKSGEGESDLTVTIQPNTGAEARTAVFVVSAEGASDIEVSLTQAAPAVATSVAELVALITSTDSKNPSVYEANIPENAPIVVSYVNGGNVHMEDATGGILLYKTDSGLAAGDKISGKLSGTGYIYNGLPEITALGDAYVKTAGTEIPETVVTISALLADFDKYMSRRVKLENVTVTKVVDDANRTGEVAQGDDKIAVYAGLKNSGLTLAEGATGDLICFPHPYKDSKQVYFWDNADFSGGATKLTTIKTADDWAKFAAAAGDYTAEETVTLAADITVTAPVDTLFCNFDGGNHTVTYAFTAGEAESISDAAKHFANLGLFRVVKNVKVSNVKTAGSIAFAPTAGSGTYHIGGIAGMAPAGVTLENCVNGVNILATTKVTHHEGGIIGYTEPADGAPVKISGCTNNGKVEMVIDGGSNASQIGGIVGHIQLSADVLSCVNNGIVNYTGTGTPRIGGVVGYANFPTDIKFVDCINNGAISSLAVGTSTSTSYSYVGGISGYYGTSVKDGYAGSGTVVYTNCVNNGDITIDCGTASTKFRNRAGGIASLISCGTGTATLTGCENKGKISILNAKGDGGHAGGIAGYVESTTTATFDSCTNDATIINETPNAKNSSTAAILGSLAANADDATHSAVNSTFKNVKVTANTVISSTTAGATSKLGIILAPQVAITTDMTGEVAACKIIRGETTTEITAENYQDYLVQVKGTASTAGVTFAGASEPAGIKTAAELLAYLANPTEDQVIGKDIDMTGVTVVPATDFTFTLDGQNHSIKGLSGSSPLFLKNSGTLKNIVTEGALTPSDKEFAVLVKENVGTIENVVNKASVTYSLTAAAEDYILMAGIAAKTTGAIKDCVNEGAVKVVSTSSVKGVGLGGIVAYQDAAVSGCVNKGDISLSAVNVSAKSAVYDATGVLPNIGGISGLGGKTGFALTSCDNYGKVSFSLSGADIDLTANLNRNQIGGVVGGPVGPVTGCKNFGEVNVSLKHSTPGTGLGKEMIVNVGGIGGGDYLFTSTSGTFANTSYTNCVNEGNVTVDSDASASNSAIGGIVGWPGQEKPITDIKTSGCTNKGTITGRGAMKCRLGGIQGGTGVIENCVNEGNIVLESGNVASAIGSVAGFHSQGHALTGSKAGGKVEAKVELTGGCGGLIGNIGNAAHTTGEGCEVNAEIVMATPDATTTGLVVGKFNGSTKAITLGTAESPIKVSGSVNGTAVTADNYTNYLYGTVNYTAGTHVINAAFGGSASSTPTVVTVDIAAYATANGWVLDADNGTPIEQFSSEGVTFTASWTGDNKNGIFWGSDWRFYQARSGGVTVSVPAGKELVKATFTYSNKNNGVLIAPDGSQLPSGTECALSGTSAAFTLGNTGTATNGQCRISKIVVEYK